MATVDKIAVELVAKMDGLQRDFAQIGNLAEQTGQRMKQAFSGIGSPMQGLSKNASAATAQFNQMGMSAKATAAAMRGVPAQMTDIIVSLQGGQKPLTVLLQQGGQLKDMFGGIGPAFRALGSAALKLVNPFTVAAAAIGGIGYAAYAGAEELRALKKAMIMTGDASGATANQLLDIANSVAKSTGATKGAAAETLTQMVATGKVAAGSLDAAAASAIRMERAGGTAAEEMVKAFAELGKAPVEASIKLNEQYNYLTASTYRQIKALEDQGRTIEAVELAQNSFAEASDAMSSRLEKNLGTLERMWRGIKGVAAGAWDAMLGVGREQSLTEQFNSLASELSRIKNDPNAAGTAGSKAKYAAGLEAKMAELAPQIEGEKAISAEKQRQNEQNRAALGWAKEAEKYLTKSERLNKEIARIKQQGAAAGASDIEIQKRISAVQDRLGEKVRAGGGSKSIKEEAASDFARLAESLREKIAVQTEELSIVGKLTAAEKDYAKFKEQLKGGKVKLAADEIKQIEALWQDHLGKAKAIEAKAQQKVFEAASVSLQTISEAFARDNAKAREALEIMPRSQRSLNASLATVDEKGRTERERLADLELKGNITKEQRIELEKKLNVVLSKQKAELTALADMQEKLNASFEYGANKGLQAYLDDVKNVAKSSEELMVGAFKGMEDALVNFVQTGKLDFKSLIDSIIAGMARISIRENITGPLAKWMNGSSSGSSSAGLFSMFSGFFGGGDIAPRWDLNALGGVYASPSLSAFSGSVVNRPTAFAFANGAGLMGEAGPEAILPLKRGRDGKLGVQAGGGRTVNITVNVSGNSSAPDVRRAAGQGAREALAAFNGAGRYA